ncbi:hypothetical protein L6164_019486 [Bauhinia variegata]|uniref:Uncharacterized protein n=1 Tax=Bauhinia variegata TaxID=167791 RepID=A0ACB9MS60_BAUVA|nr:hypothetical protein L6164_019486 [Bauhinia variegata]
MFRAGRWRSDKNRFKAVFKLQFHATQVLPSGVDALVLSIVPGDVGKPTTRLEKATIRDGICRWENPAYETVKFIQDPKSGKISERIYHIVVSTGLSKAGFIGEVSINFADYADATKPSSASLPIKNSRCDAVLHVLIQRLPENGDQREEEDCEDVKLKSNDTSLRTYLSNIDIDESIKSIFAEDFSDNVTTQRAELGPICRTSSESDITLSSSDGSSGLDTPREFGLRNTTIHQNSNGFLSSMNHISEPPNLAANASASVLEGQKKSRWDWSAGSEQSSGTDNSSNGSHDALPKSQKESDMEIDRLKAEVAALARQEDLSELELQTLRKQIVKESKRGQELSKEIISLKEERDSIKTECDNLRSFHKRMEETKLRNRSQVESGDLRTLVEEIRQELNYEKDLNANLRLQLQKTQESNAELVLAVKDLDEMLEQKDREICNLSNKYEASRNSQELRGNLSKCQTDNDEDQKVLEELVKEQSDAKETHLLEQKIIDLYGEIEIYRRDKDDLEMQLEQLALDYEILKQENHDMSYKLEQSQLQEQLKMQYECSSPADAANGLDTYVESLEDELKKQSQEFSDSRGTIKELETHIRKVEEELEKQAQGFEAALEALTRDKVEQEQRAIRAEEALRKTRLKNADAAEKLQEEFGRLSLQMAATFDANQKAVVRALTEASALRAQKSLLEEMLQKAKEELQSVKDDYEVKLNELSNQIDMMRVQIQQMLTEIDDKSKLLEHQKHVEQVNRDFSVELQMLKAENERLKAEITNLSEQAEENEIIRTDLEFTKKSVEEYETLLQRGSVERNELVNTIALLKKEAEKSLGELNSLIHLTDEKETTVKLLQSELEALRTQYGDLKHSLLEDEGEKEKLKEQIFQLKGDLKKKDDALTKVEKKLKDNNGRTSLTDGTKTSPKNKKSAPISQNPKEIASLREKIKLLEGLIKSKETALETSTASFLEKENELRNKIDELESTLEEFNLNSALHKAAEDRSGETTGTDEHGHGTTRAPEENEVAMSLLKSDSTLSENETKTDCDLHDVLTELQFVKQRNKSMESELKDMQERYSEMSLKFAEVEGERQKLVMTVRNLKNAQKA